MHRSKSHHRPECSALPTALRHITQDNGVLVTHDAAEDQAYRERQPNAQRRPACGTCGAGPLFGRPLLSFAPARTQAWLSGSRARSGDCCGDRRKDLYGVRAACPAPFDELDEVKSPLPAFGFPDEGAVAVEFVRKFALGQTGFLAHGDQLLNEPVIARLKE
jgi:hypothetical protein